MPLVKTVILASLFLAAIELSASEEPKSPLERFASKACGFRVEVPAGWRIRPVATKKCVFSVTVPDRPGGDMQLLVRDGDSTQGSDDVGFTKDHDKWMLQGERNSEAAAIDSPIWTGLEDSVNTRIYDKKGYVGIGSQTRALLFNRKNRLAEITYYNGEDAVPEFVKGFGFAAQL